MKRKNPLSDPGGEAAVSMTPAVIRRGRSAIPPKVGQKRCEVLRARFVWPE